jgi:hypothetical protein
MSFNIIDWVEILRQLHAHQAAQTILADIIAHPGVDFREQEVETLSYGLGNAGKG